MLRCNQIQFQVAFYLDGELRQEDKRLIDAHLLGCVTCREGFAQERRLVEGIRAAHPLYSAPPALRARIEQLLAPGLPIPARRSWLRWGSQTPRWFSARVATAIAAVLILSLSVLWGIMETTKRLRLDAASEFAVMAVNAHQRYLRGQLPLAIPTDSAEAISEWFQGKLPFNLKLPDYQESSGQEKLYALEGARLVGFKSDYAAYVAYRMGSRPISLVVTSSAVVRPSGGEAIASRGLVFHYDTIAGNKVITWSDRGLTYALVSDLAERGQEACMVCHLGTQDRDFIQGLKP
jgi:anti-sigma factor RsiW